MRQYLITICILLNCLAAYAQEKWNLQKCVEYAFINNISVKQADVQARLSKVSAKQSKMSLYPTLGGSINTSYQHGLNENPTTGTLESANFLSGSIGVQSGYTIFSWGSRKNNILANNLYAKADEAGIDRARNDVALSVANAFLQVMLRREQVKISELQLNQSKEQLRTTRKLVDAGTQPELNAIQIEAQVVRDTSALLQAQAFAEQAIINLKAFLNMDMAAPFDIDAPPVDDIPVDDIAAMQPEAVYNLAVTNQPLQRMTALRIEAGKYQVKSARGALYPTLSAFGGMNSRFINSKYPVFFALPYQPTSAFVKVGNDTLPVFAPQTGSTLVKNPLTRQLKNNFGQSLGLTLNFPIFNGWNSKAQLERSKINVRQTELQDEQERLNLKANIYNAYQDAFSSLQKYNAAIRNVEASQKALDISKKRFDIGLLGTLDYITTQNNLYRAKIEEVSNHYDYVFKMKVLEFYKGNGIKL